MSRQTDKIVRHFRNLARRAGEVVVYKRGDEALIASLSAVPGDSTREPIREGAAAVVQGYAEWLVLASDIAAIGKPAVGDILILGERRWRVSKSAGITFRPCDPMGVMLRVFTKAFEEAASEE